MTKNQRLQRLAETSAALHEKNIFGKAGLRDDIKEAWIKANGNTQLEPVPFKDLKPNEYQASPGVALNTGINVTATGSSNLPLSGPRLELMHGAKTPLLFRKDVKSPLPNKPERPPLERVLVHADNVRNYFIDHYKEHKWDQLDSFFCVKPPFPEMLITYDHLFTRHPDGRTVNNWRRVGMSVTQRTPEYFKYYLSPENNPTGYDPQLAEQGRLELKTLVDTVQPDSFLEMQLSFDGRGMPGRWFVMLDSKGAVQVRDPFGYIIINSPEERTYLDEIHLAEGAHEDILSKHGTIALATLQFMNCRNVVVVDNQPTRQQRRAAERERQPAPVTYKTLVIHTVGKRRAKGVVMHTGEAKALHICRGHFKDYSAGTGLGKWHRHGLWWWAAQVRGSAERGRVVKDYDVTAEDK